MKTLPLLAVDRVMLIEPSGPWLSAEGWLWVAFFLLVCIVVGGFVSVHAWRDRKSTSPEERAFRALADALPLEKREIGTLRTLATNSGIAEVALVLSEGAFDRVAGHANLPELQELRRRLFSDRSS